MYAAASDGIPYTAHTHAARTIGAQSIGVRNSPCHALNWVLNRYGCRLPRPGRIPSSWNSSDTISVPTTAAALLRVTVESSSPIAVIVRIGIRYTSRLTYTSSSPLGAETIVPDRLWSELNPDWMLPAITATVPSRMIAITAYVAAVSILPAKICQRSSERVRTVLRVPLWSSEATMSPATSAVINGNIQTAPNSRITSGTARPL